ncbi:hypothetical protein F5Y04DRAFT_105132 [Hypomontagnella monticulosa]|nr:hypothetical protein F5Y04DRAFT_105132 [Hypomontagnella monticulosa]
MPPRTKTESFRDCNLPMYPASAVAIPPPMGGHAGPDAFVTHVPDYPVLKGPGCVSDPALPQQSYIDSGAPYPDVFASVNSCRFRPLPATPPPKVNMSVRPSSSRGASSKSSTSSSFKYDKRISRDDSFVNFRARAEAEFKSYAVARGQLPTPETSPRPSPPRKTSIPTIRMPTPESFDEGRSAQIGMALGSPTSNRPPNGSLQAQGSLRTRQALTSTSTPALVSPASAISHVDSPDKDKSLRRKQSTRWKLFGRFGKKPSDNSLSAHHEPKVVGRSEQRLDMAAQPWYESKVERSNTTATRGTPRHKPIVIRSQTMPFDAESPAPTPISKSKEKDNETFGRIPIALDTNPGSSGPLLDVEIPKITMERYSIMFGSVLQSQPSLLARRQATIQKLKSIDDAIEKEEEGKHHDIPRRASSPQPGSRSPTFALFPPAPPKKPGQSSSSGTSSRLRSNTSPAQLHSPLQATFDHSAPPQRPPYKEAPKPHHYKEPPSHAVHKEKITIATLARARGQQPPPREPQFSPDSSNLVLESPTDLSSPEFEIVKSEPVRVKASYMKEPKWQMMTPPQHTPSTATSSSTSDRKPSIPSPATSTHSYPSQTSEDMDDLLENSSKMNPVELSIARQISISRQQRKLLKPLQTISTIPRVPQRSPSKPSPVPKIAMGKNERLAETKSSTPTLIVPGEAQSPAQLAQHRKSERVVLDLA